MHAPAVFCLSERVLMLMKHKLTALLLCVALTGTAAFSSGCAFLGSLSSLRQDDTAEGGDQSTADNTLLFDDGTGTATDTAKEDDSGEETTAGGSDFADMDRDILVKETDPVMRGDGVFAYDVSGVVESALPAMVTIAVATTGSPEASGSGIILASDKAYLYIMTNNHVVSGAAAIKVTFADGATYDARVKGTDSSYDLAVVLVDVKKLTDETLDAIRVARIGDSRKLKLGEGTVAIGNALGYGQSVTAGIISAVERQVEMDDGLSVPLIQTDAAINPGNSGGALLNHAGEVIGINSMKFAATAVEGTGFAIPISDAIPILQELIESVTYSEEKRGQLGISVFDVPSGYILYYGMPAGVYVQTVTKNGPAHQAGMKAGDIICAVNGRTVKNKESLLECLSRHTGGEKVQITVNRRTDVGDYETCTLTATLAVKADLPS